MHTQIQSHCPGNLAETTPPAANANFNLTGTGQSRWSSVPVCGQVQIRSWVPVTVIHSKALSQALGITPLRLRKWRSRAKGPPPEPRGEDGGCNPSPVFYRASKIHCWLDGRPSYESWLAERNWIIEHLEGHQFGSLVVSGALTQSQTEAVSAKIARLLQFPDFRALVRVRDLRESI